MCFEEKWLQNRLRADENELRSLSAVDIQGHQRGGFSIVPTSLNRCKAQPSREIVIYSIVTWKIIFARYKQSLLHRNYYPLGCYIPSIDICDAFRLCPHCHKEFVFLVIFETNGLIQDANIFA